MGGEEGRNGGRRIDGVRKEDLSQPPRTFGGHGHGGAAEIFGSLSTKIPRSTHIQRTGERQGWQIAAHKDEGRNAAWALCSQA